MRTLILTCTLLMFSTAVLTLKAQAASPFLGQIAFVPYAQVPTGWASCSGQLLPIAQNTALFSLIGTMYGGNGQTTFALPDMRGRVLISEGQGPGLSPYVVGEIGGSESVTLTTPQMPAHTHTVNAVSSEGNQNSPTGNLPADTKTLDKEYSDATANTTMKATAISPAGGNLPHENRPPFITLRCIIALQGVYPSF
ncbi:MAG: tail fiber protein [Weeksellaceae bacterium]|nr:tail fiber protein [Weeksellaceae bacterium]